MQSTAYQIFAMGMRYFLALTIIFIVARVIQHSIQEYLEIRRIRRKVEELTSAYIEVMSPQDIAGTHIRLNMENTIGTSKRCDISLKTPGLAARHASIFEYKDEPLIWKCRKRNSIKINGARVAEREAALHDGDTVSLGGFEFVFRARRELPQYE